MRTEAHTLGDRSRAARVAGGGVSALKDANHCAPRTRACCYYTCISLLTAALGDCLLFFESHLTRNLLNLPALTCCQGDGYHPVAVFVWCTGRAGQGPRLQVSSMSRFGFLILRHLRSRKVTSFPWEAFSLHFTSLFLVPKPQVAEH